MIQHMQFVPQIDSCRILSLFHWKALRLLSEAWLAARSQRQDVWQFAVEIEQLRAVGLIYTDVRCLLYWSPAGDQSGIGAGGARRRRLAAQDRGSAAAD